MKKLFILLLLVSFASVTMAHSINYELQDAANGEIVWYYLQLGFTHILPFGFDHLLFILALFIVKPNLKTILLQATVFTVAHSITLILSMLEMIDPPTPQIELLIALSIVFIGIENILLKEIKWWRYLIISMFGLIHGCGFASAISEIGLPPQDKFFSLLSFNLGVELGQAAFILLIYLIAIHWLKNKTWFNKGVTVPISFGISAIAVYWVIERALLI
ncbi:MAG: HupE/UreJ family protein [Bacteroidetes bacterium]|nr:HupE/UreJ family protein [Bacteroidota bacterium]